MDLHGVLAAVCGLGGVDGRRAGRILPKKVAPVFEHGHLQDLVSAVVVVADGEGVRSVVSRHLDSLQLRNRVIEAEDGVQAVEVLAGSQQVAARVLLDGNRPGRSGLEALAWLRQQPRLAAVPVVTFSAASRPADVEQDYTLGEAPYLVKPLKRAALGDVLRGVGRPWTLLVPVPVGGR